LPEIGLGANHEAIQAALTKRLKKLKTLYELTDGMGPTSAQRVLNAIADQVGPIRALAEIAAPPRAREAWTTS
jgi:hypothetical protein